MKICFVLEYYYPHIGGAETFFKNLIERLASRGHECYVITSKIPDSEMSEHINGVYVYRVKVPYHFDRYWFTILSIPTVFKIAQKCDIIHTMTYNGAFPALTAAKILNKRCVITIFETLGVLWKTLSGMGWLSAGLHMLIEKVTVTLPFDKYICISRYTYNNTKSLGLDENKIKIIYPGIDYNIFSARNTNCSYIRKNLNLNDNFIYLSFGRPGFFKGIEYLVRAIPLISKEIPNSKAMLILSKDPKSKYKQILSLIHKLNLGNSLILLESMNQDDLLNHISCADCIVLPSLSEGFGFTCLEASAMDKPIVATNVGSIPEVISGQYVLINPRSAIEIRNGVKSAYHKRINYHPVKYFPWETCIDEYEKVYEELSTSK